MESERDPSPPRRLHWSSIVFRAVSLVRGLLVPALGVLVVSRGERWQLVFALLFFPALGFELVRYLTRRYRFGEQDLVITEGLIFRNERHIPYQRVQSVDATQDLVQRFLGVAAVRLQTAGGSGDAEAELRVIDLEAVEELRARIFRGRAAWTAAPAGQAHASAPAREHGELVLALPPGEVVRLGLVVNRGFALVAILVGASWEFDLWERFAVLERLRAWFEGLFVQPGLVLVSLGLAAFLLLVLLSVAWSLLRFHGFTLHLRGEDLRLACGLLTRHSATVPRRRVQLVSIQARPLHRLFRRVTVRIETAGGSGGREPEGQDVISRRWFVPILPAGRVEELLRATLPAFALGEVAWQPLAPRAALRRARVGLLPGLIGGLLALWGMGLPEGLVPLLLLPALSAWLGWTAARRTQWALTPRCIAVRHGVLGRALTITLIERVQVVSLERSPFDRRWGMSALAVDTAGAGISGERVSLRDLPHEQAESLRAQLVRGAGSTEWSWG